MEPTAPSQPSASSPKAPLSSHITFTHRQLTILLMIVVPLFILLISIIEVVDANWRKQAVKKPISSLIALNRSLSPTVVPTTTAPILGAYKIIDGSVYDKKTDKLLIDKKALVHEAYKTDQVFDIIPSPDKKEIILFTYGNLSSAAIFYADTTSYTPTFIDLAEEAVWSPNSRYIAYTRKPADIGPKNLSVYDTQNQTLAKITLSVDATSSFSNLQWANDSKTLTANYETMNKPDPMSPGFKVTNKGVTKITVEEVR